MPSTASPQFLTESESLGVVGESGCGKSVSVMSVMRLIDMPPGEITKGEVLYGGRDLLKLPINEMRHIRGKEIGMVFQDPMTSLEPRATHRPADHGSAANCT